LCQKQRGAVLVGEAGSVGDAVEIILKQNPDIAIVDLNLAGDSGFDVVANVRKYNRTIRFLILTGCLDDYTILQTESFRVDGFIHKNSMEIVNAFRKALEKISHDGKYFCDLYLKARLAQKSDSRFFGKKLSDRECEIAGLAARGLSDMELGLLLNISRRTAATHRSNILRKLNLASTPKLISFAIDHGFVHLSPIPAGSSGRQVRPNTSSCPLPANELRPISEVVADGPLSKPRSASP